MVKKHHPDKGGNSEEFEKIKIAYDILKDSKSKGEFDRQLKCIYCLDDR